MNKDQFLKLVVENPVFRNIPDAIENAISMGEKSKFREVSRSIFGVEFWQQFSKGDMIVQKYYRPKEGTITTAMFKGLKARLIKCDAETYQGQTQPDKLIIQSWSKDASSAKHTLEITTPDRPLSNVEISNLKHAPQHSVCLTAANDYGHLSSNKEEYPSRINVGCWNLGTVRL